MTGDPLDRIEHGCLNPVAGWPNVEPSDVLALVEVARAARELAQDAHESLENCLNAICSSADLDDLRAALARLDKEQP